MAIMQRTFKSWRRPWWRWRALADRRARDFATETEALVARFTTPPTTERKRQINELIVTLKAAGLWTKLDALWVMAVADAQAAQRNWIANAHNLSPQAGPTFTADRGYAGNGTSSYLLTGYNPGDGGSHKYARNSAHIGLWSLTDVTASAVDIGARTGTATAQSALGLRIGTGFTPRMNQNTADTVTTANSLGHFVSSRSISTSSNHYQNGALLGTTSVASAALANREWALCAVNTNGTIAGFSTRQLSIAHAGSALTAADITALYAAFNEYMTAIGAA